MNDRRHPLPDGTDPIAAAVERAVRAARADPFVAPDEHLMRREFEELAGCLRDALQGGDSVPAGDGELDRVTLLRTLRGELLHAWPADDGSALLPTMLAFERVQDALLESRNDGDVLGSYARGLVREVAHMLRSPLGSIVMLADTMRGREVPAETRDRQLAIIHRAALGVATIAGDLLTLVGDQDPTATPEPFLLAGPLQAVADAIGPVTEVRGCRLAVHAPDADSRIGSPSAIVRALLGAALAAAVRTSDGTVELSAEPEAGDTVRFGVTARGSGAAPEDGADTLLRIFRLGPQGSSYTLSAEGLGLVATERVVKAMGAELDIEAPAADELRLTFALPLARHG